MFTMFYIFCSFTNRVDRRETRSDTGLCWRRSEQISRESVKVYIDDGGAYILPRYRSR